MTRKEGLAWSAAAASVLGAAVAGIVLLGDDDDGAGPYRALPGWPASRRDKAREIWDLASVLERISGWHGLGDFLVATAYTESRGNPKAGSSAQSNAARGWFGIRPSTAQNAAVDVDPNVLKRKRWAVAIAADIAERLGRKYSASAQRVDWLAIRRGWAAPYLVADVDETMPFDRIKPGTNRKYRDGERSTDVRLRLEKAVAATGLPDEFIYQPAFPPGFVWPGQAQALAALGAA